MRSSWGEAFLVAQMVKNLPASAGDPGLIPGSGRSPGEGNGNPLQYCCLENSVDRGGWWTSVHGVAELDMTEQLIHTHTHTHLGISRCVTVCSVVSDSFRPHEL